MEYSKIISVSGLPGLYELLSSKNDGAIVRSLDDKSTRFVSSRIHHFSHLESIEVYTTNDNINLADVFQAMAKSKEKLPDAGDNGSIKKYFEKVYPTLDFERVYSSDLKKMIKWYDVLDHNKIEVKLSEVEDEAEEVAEVAPVVKEEKPAKAAKKKPAPAAEKEKEDKPKKAPAKKKKD